MSPPESPKETARADDIPFYECWEFDEQLNHIGQGLQAGKAGDHQQEKIRHSEVARLDQSHDTLGPFHVPPAPASRGRKLKARRVSAGGFFLAAIVWMAFLLGTAALVCGGVLLGWSLLADRNELWKIGLPIAAGGQIALLVGLVLQLNRFWHINNRTVSKLDEVDDELHDLKTTASLLGAIHGPSSTAFYTHLSGGASTQLLLNDLKSRLDFLAMKIGDQE